MLSEYDLHSHSIYSDGHLSPQQLVLRAKNNGVQVLALTDHDSTNGLKEARAVAKENNMRLINGVEVSCTWGGQTIHIVGLNIDAKQKPLQKVLAKNQQFRVWRGKEIGRKLERCNVTNAYCETLKLVKGKLLTRSHYGEYLHQAGYVDSVQKAFKKYLLAGKKAHVKGQWADIATVIEAICNSGGIACIAHPKRYKMTNAKLNRLFGAFADCGGRAIEVVGANSTASDVDYLAKCATRYRFLSSLGSDFHKPSAWAELGRLLPLPRGAKLFGSCSNGTKV